MKLGGLTPTKVMEEFTRLVKDDVAREIGIAGALWASSAIPVVGPIVKVGRSIVKVASTLPTVREALTDFATGINAAVDKNEAGVEQAVYQGLTKGANVVLDVMAKVTDLDGLKTSLRKTVTGFAPLLNRTIDAALAKLVRGVRPRAVNGKARPDLIGAVTEVDYKGDKHHLWVELKPTSGDPQLHIASIEGKFQWYASRPQYKAVAEWSKKLADYLRVEHQHAPPTGTVTAPPLRGTGPNRGPSRNINHRRDYVSVLKNLRAAVARLLEHYKSEIAAIAKSPTDSKNDDVVKIVDGALRGHLNGSGVALKNEVSLAQFLEAERSKSGGKGEPLRPNELAVGSYDDLERLGAKGDDLTPHHLPMANYITRNLNVPYGDGISIMMYQPIPARTGDGGRHNRTRTWTNLAKDPALLAESPKTALTRDIADVRAIYQADGLLTPAVDVALNKVLQQWRTKLPGVF